jgi:hypothetical protein
MRPTTQSQGPTDLWTRLARLQHAHPFRITLVAFALGALALPWVSSLELNSDFQALLPANVQSVRDLDEIRERASGTAMLTLVVQATGEHPNREALHAFVRALAPRVSSRHDLQVASVDWNVADFEGFVREHRFLYADTDDLTEMRDTLRARLDWERQHANPFFIDLEGDAPPAPEAVVARMRADAEQARQAMRRFPSGFYEHPSEPLDVVFVRTSIRGGETGAIDRLVAAIEATATEIQGRAPRGTRTLGTDVGWVGDSVRIDFGGELMDMREENEALVEAAAKGVPVQIEGVVHTAKVARRDIEVMGENVDITVHRPPESLAFVDVALIHLGAYRIAKGITYRTVAANTLTGAGEGSDVRVKTTFEGMSFRRSFTPRDAALSVTADNTIKVVGLVAGGVVYVQRTPANTALLLDLQRGDTIVVVGRLAPTAPGVEKIILADAVRVLPTP